MLFKQKIFLSLFISCCLLASAQTTVPPVIPGDFADPSVISDGRSYYAVGTSSEWAPHLPIYKSHDLKKWEQSGYVFDKTPDWIIGSFWAPEYYFMNEKYYVYYTARKKKDNISCIGVAVSDKPDRDFIDKGIIVDFGKEAIDAFIVEDKGERFITFKAYGLDNRPIELLAMKLSNDGLKTEGEAFSLLKDEERIGLEGQSFLKKDDYFYLFYSAGACCGPGCDYNLRVARSKNFKGPYERYEKNPILQEFADWKCAGHGTFVQDKKGNLQYVYHAYNKASDVFTGRQGHLATLTWPEKNGWPKLQPVTTNQPASNYTITDNFKGNISSVRWQHDWRHSAPVITQQNGQLRLGGTVTSNNQTGIVLTVRPSKATFTISTSLAKGGSGLRGLAYYGDAGAALGIGVIDRQVQIWITRDKQFQVIQQAALTANSTVSLKLEKDEQQLIRFYFREGKNGWKEITLNSPIDAKFLPQWDRSPRPGLHFKGEASESAVFTSFSME